MFNQFDIDFIKKYWVNENGSLNDDPELLMKVRKAFIAVYANVSFYIVIFSISTVRECVVLDNVIKFTEIGEFSPQGTIAIVPLSSYPDLMMKAFYE